jgi:hypothetical protein
MNNEKSKQIKKYYEKNFFEYSEIIEQIPISIFHSEFNISIVKIKMI